MGRGHLWLACALVSLALISCADRRDVWSLSDQAVASFPLEAATEIRQLSPAELQSESCRAIFRVENPAELPTPPGPADLRTWLAEADFVDMTCRGSCGAETNCKVHNYISALDPQSAQTGCNCEPRNPPPCRLLATWVIGKKTRRLIERMECGRPEEAGSCALEIFNVEGGLEFGCASR